MKISLRRALELAVGPANVDAAGHAVADWCDGRNCSFTGDVIREALRQSNQPAPDAVPHDRPDTSLRAELLGKLDTQREVILSLCDRVERLEMRADGLMPWQMVERRWAKEKAGGDKLDRLIAQDQEADEPAVPDDREPAAVRAVFNAGRRWGHQPAPPAEGEVGELEPALPLPTGKESTRLRNCPTHGQQPPWAWGCPECVRQLREELAALQQRHPEPVPVSERLPVDVEQALIKAECALSDIAEGEPEENDGDADALLQWAEQRAATALSRIRPVMRLHGILTSEWPPLPATALPLPAGEGES